MDQCRDSIKCRDSLCRDSLNSWTTMSYSQLEAATGVSTTTWSRWKSQSKSPRLCTLEAVASALGLDAVKFVEEFFEWRKPKVVPYAIVAGNRR